MDPDMAGKWICPMHPSVVRDTAGKCDICGMDLVTTESLGYVKAELTEQPPLVIPTSAPLITGKRAVVYVQLHDPNRPIFEGIDVILGPRAGDYYLVEQGLDEGDRVVTKGNFKIDSALQIQAKTSMMNREGQMSKPMPSGHHH
jgi:Cu(I)/Ag(I) efflux system membrane fusion protein